jgi:FkbM family methyltransferase
MDFHDYTVYWDENTKPAVLTLTDSSPQSSAVRGIALGELSSQYTLEGLEVEEGDVMIDIGGHCGVVSVFYAKFFPELKIYTYEPVAENYEALQANIEANNVTNVKAFNLAVTADGRDVELCQPRGNTGGANITDFLAAEESEYMSFHSAKSTTLDEIFEQNNIKKCKVMKMDCECSEHEIIKSYSFRHKIENFLGEFHINGRLKKNGHSIEALMYLLRENGVRIQVNPIEVADSVELDGSIMSLDRGYLGNL